LWFLRSFLGADNTGCDLPEGAPVVAGAKENAPRPVRVGGVDHNVSA
jgi:hypothetical protein